MNAFSTTQELLVSAPSRIHFGLFSIGDLCEREFGGVGLMLNHPRTELTFRKSSQFAIETECEDVRTRIASVVNKWRQDFGAEFSDLDNLKICIRVEKLPPAHVGLGSGTQLAMAVTHGLCTFFELPAPSIDELVLVTKRAERSAIGSHGFSRGGLLVDRGRKPDDSFAALDFHDLFPDWPIVLAIADSETRVFGNHELKAFQELPATAPQTREAMIEIVRGGMLPALMQNDYDAFADSVFEVGQGSGRMFESIQGGIYNGPKVTALVNAIRDFGVPAVGQSSWGPCVFAITRDIETATDLVDFLKANQPSCEIIQTTADNCGVQISKRQLG